MAIRLDYTPQNITQRIASKVRRTWRDIRRSSMRKRVASFPPYKKSNVQQVFSVHMLLCKRDLQMGIIAAKSFVWACGKVYKFTFHDDGSLTPQDKKMLLTHFPGSELIDYEVSLRKAADTFGIESEIYKMRLKGVMMLKLIDVRLFSNQSKAILLDSDILFFEYPEALLKAAMDEKYPNVFNKDIETAYMVDKVILEEICGQPLPEQINAGLSVLNTEAIDFEKLEKWLVELHKKNIPIIMHRIEQSLVAMLCASSIQKIDYLPPAYDVAFFKDVHQSVCKHYVGRIRHGFELEGLAYLLEEKSFASSWMQFINKN